MQSGDYQTIMRCNPFRSNKNSFYFYSCSAVAEYIEAETSFHCVLCGEVHDSLNLLRKHLNSIHRVQFWYFLTYLVTFVWTTGAASQESNAFSLMDRCKCISNRVTSAKVEKCCSITPLANSAQEGSMIWMRSDCTYA